MTRTQGSTPDDTVVFSPVPGLDDADDIEEREDSLAGELAKAAPRRWWNRGTLVLGALALLVGGFLGGAQVQKHYGTASAASNVPAGFAAGQGRGGFTGGTPRNGGATPTASAAATGTTGTVKLVDGTTIYLQSADGTLVTVKTSGKTTVRTATKAALKDVRAGDTVTVQGSTADDGSVTATALTADRK